MPTIRILLDTRRAKKDGTYPAKIRLTDGRTQKYYPTGKSYTRDHYSLIMAPTVRSKANRDERAYLDQIARRATEALQRLEQAGGFSFAAFRRELFGASRNRGELIPAMHEYINRLRSEGRESTATSYSNAAKSLEKFFGPRMLLREIAPPGLKRYEEAMLKQGNSLSTVGIYLRSLRAVLNHAIESGELPRSLYPFGRHGYTIPTGRNTKRALSAEDIRKIFESDPGEWTPRGRAKDYWLFSYFCGGMNIKDMARLGWPDIQGDQIHYTRAKTRGKGSAAPIIIQLLPEAREILDRRANPRRSRYVFPILEPGCTPEREYQLIKQFTQVINRRMKDLARSLGITAPVTTYTARHSFATILMRSGAPVEFISGQLGHTSLKTTENYLGSFEDDKARGFLEGLRVTGASPDE